MASAVLSRVWLAASSGQAEIQVGKLAAERAESAEVCDLANRLEKDHTQANLAFLKIVDAQRINISRDIEPYQAVVAELTQPHAPVFCRWAVPGRPAASHTMHSGW